MTKDEWLRQHLEWDREHVEQMKQGLELCESGQMRVFSNNVDTTPEYMAFLRKAIADMEALLTKVGASLNA
jgi:bacterioferritin (cytochrome b1)